MLHAEGQRRGQAGGDSALRNQAAAVAAERQRPPVAETRRNVKETSIMKTETENHSDQKTKLKKSQTALQK
jgi:hypothetical protein